MKKGSIASDFEVTLKTSLFTRSCVSRSAWYASDVYLPCQNK